MNVVCSPRLKVMTVAAVAAGLLACQGDDGAAGAGGATPGATGASSGSAGAPGSSGSSGAPGSSGSSGAPAADGGSSSGDAAADAGPSHTPWVCKPAGTAAGSIASGAWQNVTANLAGMSSECGNLSFLTAKPDVDMLVAGVAQHGLWASTNGGGSWTQLGTGSGSAAITNRMSMAIYDPDHPATFWESGIYNGGGVYRTTDNGATFTQLGDATHDDSVGIDFTDPQRQTLLAGGHERSGRVLLSKNGGSTWTDIGPKLPAHSGFSSQVVVLDSKTFLVGTTFDYGDSMSTPGIFRSTDGGDTWTKVSPFFSGNAPLVASDGALYWPLNDKAWYDNGGLARSTDHGQTWTKVVPPNALSLRTPVELPDGRLVAIGPNNLMLSVDCGVTWSPITPTLPYPPDGFVYTRFQKAFFLRHFTCDNPVPNDAIMRFDWDYTKN
jgi:BNR/Asp-box repeat